MITPAQQATANAGSAAAAAAQNAANGVPNPAAPTPAPAAAGPVITPAMKAFNESMINPTPAVVAKTRPPSEPTVLSSSNIDENVIPNNNTALANLSTKGSYSQDGATYRADGSAAPTPAATAASTSILPAAYDPETDPETAKINSQIGTLQDNLDASTKQSIDTIEQQYSQLISQQQQINTQAAGARTAALLTGGTSRYSPDTASGIMKTQLSYGLQQIAKLDADENNAIAQAKQAQQTGDAQLADKLITDAQDIRSQKATIANQLNDALSKANQASLDSQRLSSVGTAVAGLLEQGVTDPAQILDYVNTYDDGSSTGANLTADELGTMLKTLKTTTGTDDLSNYSGDIKNFEALAQSKQLPAAVAALPADRQLQAYLKMIHDAATTVKPVSAIGSGTSSGNSSGSSAGGTGSGGDNTNWLAQFYGSGGNVNLPALGMGTAAVEMKTAILNRIAANAQTLGIDGGQMAAILSDKKSAQTALTALSKNQAQMSVSEQTASKNFDQVLQQMSTLPPKTFNSLLNQFIQTGAIASGDPNVKPFAALLYSTLTEYGKVISGQTGGAGVSDSARSEATAMLSAADTPATFQKFVDIAKQEMGNRADAYSTAKSSLFNLIQNPTGEVGNMAANSEDAATDALSAFAGQSAQNAAMLQEISAKYPNMTATEVAQYLGLDTGGYGSSGPSGTNTTFDNSNVNSDVASGALSF